MKTLERGGFRRGGLYRLRKNPSHCHPEEAKPTKDLCICLKIQIQGSFATLRMTAGKRFSAACKARRYELRLDPTFSATSKGPV